METIGLIGVGLLGTALGARITAGGYRLVGFDPDPDALNRLRLLGGSAADSQQEVVRSCRRIFFSLPGPQQVQQTVEAIHDHLAPGAIILDTTTGDPEQVEQTAQRLARQGVSYLDCEVGGSSKQTAAGEAILICGGDGEAFEQCRTLLQSVSTRIFHTGPPGTGTRMKLALNIAIGLHRAVLAESLGFASANGIEPARALEVLKAGPAYSRAMDVKGHKMLSGDFTPEARLKQHLKDVRLIIKTGEAVGARVDLSRLHEALLDEAVELGLGDSDNSAISKLFARRQG